MRTRLKIKYNKRRCLRLYLSAFEVLSELEKVNIVHRDITPKNILISSDNVVKLIDFGISRKTKEGRTKDTTILGTAGYAAPEQFDLCRLIYGVTYILLVSFFMKCLRKNA